MLRSFYDSNNIELHDFFSDGNLARLHQVILEQMVHAYDQDLEVLESAAASGSSAVEKEVIESTAKKGGYIQKANDWVRPYSIFVMDAYCMVTKPLRKAYCHRAAEVKTPADLLEWSIKRQKNGMYGELSQIALAAFRNEEAIRRTLAGAPTDADQERWVQEIVDLTFETCYSRCESELQEIDAYPGCSVAALDSDGETSQGARAGMLFHLKTILHVEQLARHHDDLADILQSVGPWINNEVVRLMLHAVELEGVEAVGDDAELSTYLLQAQHVRLGDEKWAEDLHQYIRDKTRYKREKKVSALRIMRTIIDCGLPRQRGMENVVEVADEELCRATRYNSLSRTAVAHHFSSPPEDMPPELEEITRKDANYPSPISSTAFMGVSAWQWLLEYFVHWDEGAAQKPPVGAGWRARACRAKVLVHDESTKCTFAVVAACTWGLYAWLCELVDDDTWRLSLEGREAVEWTFVYTTRNYLVSPIKGGFINGAGIVFHSRAWTPLLEDFLLRRVAFTKKQFKDPPK